MVSFPIFSNYFSSSTLWIKTRLSRVETSTIRFWLEHIVNVTKILFKEAKKSTSNEHLGDEKGEKVWRIWNIGFLLLSLHLRYQTQPLTIRMGTVNWLNRFGIQVFVYFEHSYFCLISGIWGNFFISGMCEGHIHFMREIDNRLQTNWIHSRLYFALNSDRRIVNSGIILY